MIRTSGAIGTSPRRVPPPKNFDWDFASHPVRIFDNGGRYKADFDPRSKVAPGIWSGPEYWVSYDGSDSNEGKSPRTALASAWKARQLAEADPLAANGYSINFMPDPATGLMFLDQARGLNNTAETDPAALSDTCNRPFALICHGGRLVMGPRQQLSFSPASEETNTWVGASVSGDIAAVYNIGELGPFGVQSRIEKITGGVSDDSAAEAAVAAAPGDAWAQAPGSLNVYVRLASGQIPSNATVLVAQTSHALRLGTADVYLAGVELIGGSVGGGGVDVRGAAARTLVFEDVGAWGQGATDGAAQPAFGIDGMTGLAVFHRCYGYNSLGSIFSLRNPAGEAHALMIDCWGIDAGYPGASPASYANQIVAAGDMVRLISLNMRGSYSAGACVGGSGNSQHWDLGSIYAYDRGDLWLGPDGAIPSTGVRLEGHARYWGQDITVGGCATSFHASSKNARIALRSPIEIGGRRKGPGIIGEY